MVSPHSLLLFVCICIFTCDVSAARRLQIEETNFHWRKGGLTLSEMQQWGRDNEIWAERALNEEKRLSAISEVPHSLPTFTKLGFHKEMFDRDAWKLVLDFYNNNKERRDTTVEVWTNNDIFVNHYDVSPTVLHIPEALKRKLTPYIQKQIARWSGVAYGDLEFTSLYGIRSYHNGNLLRVHPDRDDVLVLSMIVNVDQDADEGWPLEIYDHEGNLHSFLLEPGEIVFYESSTCIHGRPTPFRGRYYANFFAHFRPVGWLETVRKFRDENGIADPREGVIQFDGRAKSDGWGGIQEEELFEHD